MSYHPFATTHFVRQTDLTVLMQQFMLLEQDAILIARHAAKLLKMRKSKRKHRRRVHGITLKR